MGLAKISCDARAPAGLQLEPAAGLNGIVRCRAVAHARLHNRNHIRRDRLDHR